MKTDFNRVPQNLVELLEEKAEEYNRKSFIEADPISIPHQYTKKEDIEIAGLLTAIIAWGQRKTLIRNAEDLMRRMDHQPADFVMNHSPSDLKTMKGFVHRTFSESDCKAMVASLKIVCLREGGLENAFLLGNPSNVFEAICGFRAKMLQAGLPVTVARHLANPASGSAAKRINMFLRWMVRKDNRKVDFGLWTGLAMRDLKIPLDVHSGGVARKLGILQRKQDDWRAVEELTAVLSSIDPLDPVRFDYALFGMGVNEKLSRP